MPKTMPTRAWMLARTWASDYRSRRLKKWVGLVAVRSGVRAATRLTRPIGPRPGVVTASTKKVRKNFCEYSEYLQHYPQSTGRLQDRPASQTEVASNSRS